MDIQKMVAAKSWMDEARYPISLMEPIPLEINQMQTVKHCGQDLTSSGISEYLSYVSELAY